MNFGRLFIVLPIYVLIVTVLETSGIVAYIAVIPMTWMSAWAIELGALALGAGGTYFYHREGGFLARNPTLFHHIISHTLIGLAFASMFGLFSLVQNKFPYIPSLIIIPLAFGLSELLYIVIMRAWNDRKRRQQEFRDDI